MRRNRRVNRISKAMHEGIWFAITTACVSIGFFLVMYAKIWMDGSYRVVEPSKMVLTIETIVFSLMFVGLVVIAVKWWRKDWRS